MRVLADNFGSPDLIDVAIALSKRGFNFIYINGKSKACDLLKNNQQYFKDTIFHDYTDALAGIPAPEVDVSSFRPLGTDLIHPLSLYESSVLSMMTRIDFDNLDFSEKQYRYYQYVWYWYNVLSILKPDIVIFRDVPHVAYNTVLYYIAKQLGIKTVIFRKFSCIMYRVVYQHDLFDYKEIREEYQRLKLAKIGEQDVDNSLKDFYNGLNYIHTEKGFSKQYMAISRFAGKEKAVEVFPKFDRVLKNIKNYTFFSTFFNYLRLLFHRFEICSINKKTELGLTIKWRNFWHARVRARFRKEYESLQVNNVDFSRPYIYMPLHRQPEGSTNPMGGIFDNQILAIDLLAATLPEGWLLYVKEHPTQWRFPLAHLGRYNNYYRLINRHKNIRLISTAVSGFDLIDHSKAVATITGTAGFEAIMRGKPALIFGFPSYRDCEGVLQVSNFNDCLEAVKKVYDGYIPDKMNVLRFMQAAKNMNVNAYINIYHGRNSGLSYEQNIKNLTDGLYKACLS